MGTKSTVPPASMDAATLELVRAARRRRVFLNVIVGVIDLALKAALGFGVAVAALEFHAGYSHAQAVADCRQAGAELPDAPARAALIVANPTCAHVVSVRTRD